MPLQHWYSHFIANAFDAVQVFCTARTTPVRTWYGILVYFTANGIYTLSKVFCMCDRAWEAMKRWSSSNPTARQPRDCQDAADLPLALWIEFESVLVREYKIGANFMHKRTHFRIKASCAIIECSTNNDLFCQFYRVDK